MRRFCFVLKIRNDRVAEYRKRHHEVWPEMQAALQASGWRDYSLFLRGDGLLIGYVTTDDFERARKTMRGARGERAVAGGDGSFF